MRKSACCTDVCTYLSKYRQRVCRIYGNCDVNKYEFVAIKVSRWALLGVIVHWHLLILHFLGLKYTASPDWSKDLFKPVNIDFTFKALRKLAVFRYGGFEFETVSDKWLHETDEEDKKCKKAKKQTQTRQQPFKKGWVGINKSSSHSALLLENVFCGLWSRTTLIVVHKIKVSKCYSVPVL